MAVATLSANMGPPTNPSAHCFYESRMHDPHFNLEQLSCSMPHPVAAGAIRIATDAAAAAAAETAFVSSAVRHMMRTRGDRRHGAVAARQRPGPYSDPHSRAGAALRFSPPLTAADRFFTQMRVIAPWGSTGMGPRLGGPLRERVDARADPLPEYDVVDVSPNFGDAQRALPGSLAQQALGLGFPLGPRRDQTTEHAGEPPVYRSLGANGLTRPLQPAAPSPACCMRGRELTDEQRRLLDAHLEDLGGDALRKTICCPVTHDVMQDPVVAADGHTYERAAIERSLAAKACSPMTNNPMGPELIPNIAVRALIDATLEKIKKGIKKGLPGPADPAAKDPDVPAAKEDAPDEHA